MPLVTFREALCQALDAEMERDPHVVLLGEEVAQYEGAYKVSKGLLKKYGQDRVVDTPISEEGFTGIGIGMAMMGLRPIVEWMTLNFSLVAIDQVINNAAKLRYMSGGQIKVPIVFRGPNGAAGYLGSQHSQALESLYAHCPGLYVAAPATPRDAKGMLQSAIRNDNPVVFCESELMYSLKGSVPEGDCIIPFGEADVKKQGKDLTILTYSKPYHWVVKAGEILSREGIEIEIVDIRFLRPLDEATIFTSVRKTGRCVIVSETWPVASFAAYLSHRVMQECFDYLDAPVELVCSLDVPMPYNHHLELKVQPSAEKIVQAAKKVLYQF